MKKLNLVAAIVLLVGTSANAATMQFDFGNGTFEAGGNYNLVYSATSHNLPNAVDSTGAATGISMVTAGFHEFGGNESGTNAPAGDAAGLDPNATIDSLYGHANAGWGSAPPRTTGTLTMSGLDGSGNTTYDFSFFASRMGVSDVRDARYTVAGLNSGDDVLDAANNTSNLAYVNGITPTPAGEIVITVEKGPNNSNGVGFFYLGAMEVTSTTIPEPSTIALLGLGGVLLALRYRR
ncbi:PEP-CTERM sorting domain-containing protein [Aeoliella sp.]|uniref:PEP-CTERM sorting domain-containing protein n=1 Tax=Aeoliella sp. TaxID=2795800 RepID=UPI003CCC0991